MAAEAAFAFEDDDRAPVLALSGDWTVSTIASLEPRLKEVADRIKPGAVVDVSKLGRLDVAGAFLIDRTFRESPGGESTRVAIRGQHATAMQLLATARKAYAEPQQPDQGTPGFRGFLERVGRIMGAVGDDVVETVGFFGETLVIISRLIRNPRKIRWVSVVRTMEIAGFDAIPIVVMLSFAIGLVVAYLGARILGDFGASVFTVELVTFSVMREFGAVLTAILLAGRTGSSFTAEIGAMKMRQEVDAMRVLGIQPMEALVAPRVIAMVVVAPILTFASVMAGIFGGLLVAWGDLGVSPHMFFSRISENVPSQHFWVGMLKSPFFALVIAIIGCKQGLSVGDDVGSLGKRVTTSVVQSIFMVILLDALFAIWFLEMNW